MKYLSILLFFFVGSYYFGQNKSFLYTVSYKIGDKDPLIARNYYLDIVGQQSAFRYESDRRTDSITATTGQTFGVRTNYERQIYVCKDHKTGKVSKRIRTMERKEYAVLIDEKLNWKIFPETKKLEDIRVQKAEVDYGGRHWIAWFAPDIPISEGPYVFEGLPGLIVQITDDRKDYDFTLAKISKGRELLYINEKPLEMSYPTFKKLAMEYYQDPYSYYRGTDVRIARDNGRGEPIRMTYKEATDRFQENIKRENNPIELNYKNDYSQKTKVPTESSIKN